MWSLVLFLARNTDTDSLILGDAPIHTHTPSKTRSHTHTPLYAHKGTDTHTHAHMHTHFLGLALMHWKCSFLFEQQRAAAGIGKEEADHHGNALFVEYDPLLDLMEACLRFFSCMSFFFLLSCSLFVVSFLFLVLFVFVSRVYPPSSPPPTGTHVTPVVWIRLGVPRWRRFPSGWTSCRCSNTRSAHPLVPLQAPWERHPPHWSLRTAPGLASLMSWTASPPPPRRLLAASALVDSRAC